MRTGGGVLRRLVWVDGQGVVVRAAQPARDRVVMDARGPSRKIVEYALERWRFALGVDDDVRPFLERFRWDPLIGRLIRVNPGLRPARRPEPFEALAWAVCEQLIDGERAGEIERRIVRAAGPRCSRTGLRAVPDAAAVAALTPPRLESFGLAPKRAVALVRVAHEVAAGRIDLHGADHERAWHRLRAIPEIGSWTVETLALEGQGRHDQVPAGDLAFVKLVGRLRDGHPRARADEDEVRDFFERYQPWAGLAGTYAVRSRPWLRAPV